MIKFAHCLITGGSGWLGAHVVRALTQGEVLGYEAPFSCDAISAIVPEGEDPSNLRKAGVDVITGNLTSRETISEFSSLAKNSLLIHLAGVIHPRIFVREFDAVNFTATCNLVSACVENGARKAVVMSSNSPLGANPSRHHLFTEDSPYTPYMGYGKSKMKMEKSLTTLSNTQTDCEIVTLRAPWFYGPGQPRRQTEFFTMIRKGVFPLFGDGGSRRSMGYVENLSEGIMRACATENLHGETFWIADERPYSMNDIITTVKQVLADDIGLDVSERQLRLPSVVPDIARLADASLQRLGLYHQKIHVLSEMNLDIACAVDKARDVLGYEPKIALREGMRRSVKWCLESGIEI